MQISNRNSIRSGGITGIVLLIAGGVRVVSPVVVFLFLFFHFSGCEFSPTDPETDDQNQGPTVVTVGDGIENPQPLGVAGTWKLVFSDEFEGTSLDLTKWHPNWFGRDDNAITRPINDAEASCYDPAQVTVSGGYLHFTAVSSDHPECVKKDGTRADYASGMIMSNGRYHFTYGFIEARIYLPPGTGTAQNWAAFWTNGQDWPQDGEIDIMETLGGGGYTRWTYHYDVDSGPDEDHRSYTPGGNMIDESGWHVFGAYWQPDQITFYYDGVEVGYVTSSDLEGGASITSSSHYIILNLALNKKYPITVPSTMMVDYVRHWTHGTVLGIFSSNEYDHVSRSIH
jgi:beta-glucanase (GH16 family)